KADPLSRLAAAEVLGRCHLNDEQLGRALRAVGGEALISPSVLLPMLRRSATAESGPAVLDYLAQAREGGGRAGRAELGKRPDGRPRAVKAKALPVRDAWRKASGRERALLAEHEPLLAGGDAQRGRAVFRGAKVACLSCHKVGGEGGG